MTNLRLALMSGFVVLSASTIIQILVTYALCTVWIEERAGHWIVMIARRNETSSSARIYAEPGEYFPNSLLYRDRPVDPHPYELTINQPNLCKNEEGEGVEVFLLVLVISAPRNFALRLQIRETYLQVTEVSGRRIKHLFLLAQSKSKKTNSFIELESRRYRDIAKENFADSYRNLSLKTVMGLKWASTYCPQATWVLKVDDDVLVNLKKAVPYFEGFGPAKNMIVGEVVESPTPIRDKRSKWFVSPEEYAHDHYPSYASGGGYVISGELVPRLYNESLRVPLFHIEDAFVGILAERLGAIYLRHSTKFYSNYHQFSERKIMRAITFHMPNESLERRKRAWEMINPPRAAASNLSSQGPPGGVA